MNRRGHLAVEKLYTTMSVSLLILAVSALVAVTAEQCGKCPFPIQKVKAKDAIVFAVIGGEGAGLRRLGPKSKR